ncbi:glycosyltransferase family 1 protein [Hydnum rufescens UP504]|uniref:UDP-N-acetylglucosamine transferase subunit ALG14 n=1 Tax=Hydnum rufescens UP504 TaxID=1448309 RepID=A0A9P6DR20_9AGAM|nr:glycosyltransferase family 1 protein [Hydnum rufescens UP504]
MWLFVLSLFIVVFCLRVYTILPKEGRSARRNAKRRPVDTCSLAVFLGSGGHTGEAILLLSSLDFTRYTPRTYIISEGTHLAPRKLSTLKPADMRTIPIMEITQLYSSLVPDVPALRRQPFADVLILNGPGTFPRLPSPRLIYVESFARVKKLSLSGKLLRPFVDRFLSQWPAPIQDRGRGECTGWLV